MTGSVRYSYEKKFTDARSGENFANKLLESYQRAKDLGMQYQQYCEHLKQQKLVEQE
jgi:hypothetical protein